MSDHAGMIDREELRSWLHNHWRQYAASSTPAGRLRMEANMVGTLRVRLDDEVLHTCDTFDAAIRAWDGAGSPCVDRRGTRSVLCGLGWKVAQNLLRNDVQVVLYDPGDGWRSGHDGEYSDTAADAAVVRFGEAQNSVYGGTIIYPLIPD